MVYAISPSDISPWSLPLGQFPRRHSPLGHFPKDISFILNTIRKIMYYVAQIRLCMTSLDTFSIDLPSKLNQEFGFMSRVPIKAIEARAAIRDLSTHTTSMSHLI